MPAACLPGGPGRLPEVGEQGLALEEAQYAYSAAIRWGDFEGAWNLVDPEYREEHPLSDIDFSRYKQVQISGYRELGAMPATPVVT